VCSAAWGGSPGTVHLNRKFRHHARAPNIGRESGRDSERERAGGALLRALHAPGGPDDACITRDFHTSLCPAP
jgi:hypothetical protein